MWQARVRGCGIVQGTEIAYRRKISDHRADTIVAADSEIFTQVFVISQIEKIPVADEDVWQGRSQILTRRSRAFRFCTEKISFPSSSA